ncbi:MAG: glycosyltransferase family 1 protein [Clostridia bacterium]|nr:glycosyltransferase family 1 protein [Clostridia bacterium]
MAVKRLLCIVGSMDAGGAETFLMKVYRGLDKTKYQMDFAVAKEEKGCYDDEILSMGGKIFHIVPKSKGLIKNFNDIRKLVKREKYKYVLRTSQNSLSALELFAAKLGGAKVRVYRSSNSSINTAKENIFHKLFGFMTRIFPNVRIAPSTEAAEFMFGKKCVKRGKAHLLHNGLDVSQFRFDPETRDAVKEQFDLEGKLVVGHVGRFNVQKNHGFLIDVFKEVSLKCENAVLMLVGVGELEQEIRKKVSALGLDDKVIFMGRRSDVPRLLSAFDLMLMPSLYEGMPNVVIEAQATGLPCVISDTITPEADITGLVSYMPLSAATDTWADKVLETVEKTARKDTSEQFEKEGYELSAVTRKFVDLIFEGETE